MSALERPEREKKTPPLKSEFLVLKQPLFMLFLACNIRATVHFETIEVEELSRDKPFVGRVLSSAAAITDGLGAADVYRASRSETGLTREVIKITSHSHSPSPRRPVPHGARS
jgi:hypothetical protein